ncbi:MAG: DNA gyrase modulator, partial [Candidatus Bathyarchaeia archaeon]
MSIDFGKLALEEAAKRGASYADIRISEILNENLTVKNGEPETTSFSQLKGFGVRVIVNGAWGFAGSVNVSKEEIKRCVKLAVDIAKASAMLKKKEVVLAAEKIYREKYATSFKKDPFKVSLEEKLKVLVEASRFLKEFSPLVNVSYAHYRGYRENKFFMSSEGAEINQQITWCGGGISAIAVKGSEVQVRSYPSAFR